MIGKREKLRGCARESIELFTTTVWNGQGDILGDWATGVVAKVKLNKKTPVQGRMGEIIKVLVLQGL